jgi:DUF3037 family protein
VAFYSLIRYISDLERQEPLNVGVLAGSTGEVAVQLAEDAESLDDFEVIRRFQELLEYLVDEERRSQPGDLDVHDFLDRLAYRRFSHFNITEPRQIATSEPPRAIAKHVTRALAEDPLASKHLIAF